MKKYFEKLKYNELYTNTANENILNGYTSTDYKIICDYKAIVNLLKKIKFSSICDLGCGTGILLKYIQEEIGSKIEPFGFEYNPVAFNILISKIFPNHKDNFQCIDINKLKRIPMTDVVIVMLGCDYQKKIYRLINNTKYVIFRLTKEQKYYNLHQKYMTEFNSMKLIGEESLSSYHYYRLYSTK